MFIEAFIAQPAVEALDESALQRPAGLDGIRSGAGSGLRGVGLATCGGKSIIKPLVLIMDCERLINDDYRCKNSGW
jgi:hypothetical protein